MPWWTPGRIWDGEDAYIIGGGASLRGFNWGLLQGKNTIGCNGAYSLGAQIVKICLFADFMWWEEFGREGLAEYGGISVAASPRMHNCLESIPWLMQMRRNNVREVGKDKLLFCGNVGAMAINLAFILGAKRVFLLGFDMKLAPLDEELKEAWAARRKAKGKKADKGPGHGRANWHNLRYEFAREAPYRRFCTEMRFIPKTMHKAFPGVEVFNVTNDSNLDCFPKISLEEHFGKENLCLTPS